MIALIRSRCLMLLLSAGIFLPPASRAALWCTAYFVGYDDGNTMDPSNIDFSVVTHVVHFSVIPNADGSLDPDSNGITPEASAALISVAHAANRKALICVGGQDSVNFQSACSNANLGNFVSNLTNFMASRGYDGIDIDWEPYEDSNGPFFSNLVVQLRTALNTMNPRPLLTTALPLPTPWDASALPALMASLTNQFDQINLQTYDLSGPYPGWITWHNSAIYDNGQTLPGNLTVPSVNGAVMRFISAGVPAAKLGLGITFHGQLWTGEAVPTQPLTSSPTMNPITYNQILATYSASPHFWDQGAQAPYISLTNSDPNQSIFISYDDTRAVEGKVSYARDQGLGGMIIWELKQDHTSTSPDPLLNAVKLALQTPGTMAIQKSGQNINLNFQAAPLGSYSVQWTTNLTLSNWNTLTTTNVTNASSVIQIQVTDSAPTNRARFYRVKTPP